MTQDNTAPQNPDLEPQNELESRIAVLEAELSDTKDNALRMLAEADNIKKRAEKLADDTRKYAVAGFAKDMLDSADNLRRALDAIKPEHIEANDVIKTLHDGVAATERAMLAAFERQGVRRIAPTSGKFDPNQHEVLFETPVSGKEAGEIIQLIDVGYMLHDRLLRAAKVGVAKGDPSAKQGHQLDEQA